MSSFNLLDEKWIPVVSPDTTTRNVGLREALLNAHAYAELRDSSPLVTLSLHRFLLAVLHRALKGPENLDAWTSLWKSGRFPSDALDVYLKQWKDRFNLYDEKYPFYQKQHLKGEDTKPITYLTSVLPTDTNIAHFRHNQDAQGALCQSCCAKGLLQTSAYATVGGRSIAASINDAPPVYFQPKGSTLFHTLMLNLFVGEFQSKDVPAWEDSTASSGPIGLCEGLTWQPRVILLDKAAPSGSCTLCGAVETPIVKSMVYKGGRSRSQERERPWTDPQVAVVEGKKPQALRPPNPQLSKVGFASFWRLQARAILTALTSDDSTPPVLSQAGKLLREGSLVLPDIHVETMSLHTDGKAKMFLYSSREWIFPASYAKDAVLRDDAIKSLETVKDFFENFEKQTHRQTRYESLSKTNVSVARASFEPQAEYVLRNMFSKGSVLELELKQSLQETLTVDNVQNTQTFQTNTEARPGYLAFLNRLRELPASDLKLLRECTGGTPGSDVRAFDLFTEIFWELRQKYKQLNRETCWLTATLYAWHSRESHDEQYGSLAAVLKRVHQKTCRNDESKKTARNRFMRMLNLSRKELGPPLADVLRLFNHQSLAVYWPRLLDDLSRWNDPDRSVQQCWEQEYPVSRKQ